MEKSKAKELLESVRVFFTKNGIDAVITEPVDYTERLEKVIAFAKDKDSGTLEKFEDVILADETVAIVEPTLEAGAAIVIMDSEGTPVGAPVGEYELQDGRVIIVEKEGVILEIKEAVGADGEGAEEETLDSDLPGDVDSEEQKVKKIIERIETEKVFVKIADFNKVAEELETANKTNKFLVEDNELMADKYKEVVTKFEAMQKFVQTTFEKLLDEPAQEPTVKNNNPLKQEEKVNIFHKPLIRD